jgi:hypothetical protein
MYKHRYVYHFFVLVLVSISSDQVNGIYLKFALCKLVIPETPNSLALVRALLALRQRKRELRLKLESVPYFHKRKSFPQPFHHPEHK